MDSNDTTIKASSSIGSRYIHIPTEVIEKIVKELAERYMGVQSLTDDALNALAQCSLVNRDFRFYSQQELFRVLVFRYEHVNWKRLLALLRDAPHICDMVKVLDLTGNVFYLAEKISGAEGRAGSNIHLPSLTNFSCLCMTL